MISRRGLFGAMSGLVAVPFVKAEVPKTKRIPVMVRWFDKEWGVGSVRTQSWRPRYFDVRLKGSREDMLIYLWPGHQIEVDVEEPATVKAVYHGGDLLPFEVVEL